MPPANNAPTAACGFLGLEQGRALRPCPAAWGPPAPSPSPPPPACFLAVRRPHPARSSSVNKGNDTAQAGVQPRIPLGRTSKHHAPRSAAAKNSSGVMMCSGMGMDAKMLHLKPTKNAPRRRRAFQQTKNLGQGSKPISLAYTDTSAWGLHWVQDAQQLWFVAWRSRRKHL